MKYLFFLLPQFAIALSFNVIGYNNGVGLDQDIAILSTELTRLGHHVEFVHWRDFSPKPKADYNIFLETVDELFFPLAHKNCLIPNPEWYQKPALIPKFDLILCKTKEALRIFGAHNPGAVYMGFTSKDCYEEREKNPRALLHLAGRSEQKGTDTIVDVWQKDPKLPTLQLLRLIEPHYPAIPNVSQITEYLPTPELKALQNHHLIHLCPSETEGFGHYLVEAMSTGAVVITTDAPPMNEFITDPRCLVKTNRTQRQYLATNYYIDQAHLAATLTQLLSLSDEELRAMGRKNREQYLENDRLFKQRLAEIFGALK